MHKSKYTNIAFISYKREDEEWAKWLQKKLEHYKLPTEICKQNPNLEFAKNPRHVFKDTTDLSGGVLAKAIKDGLDSSKYLIVICSPRAAKSEWVCKEVQDFIDSGREEYIIPFIIDGEPYARNQENECFPESLKTLAGERELLGININENGRESAAVKVVSRVFDLRFDILWNRFQREQKKRRRYTIVGLVATILVVAGIAGFIWTQNQELDKRNYQIKKQYEEIRIKNAQIEQQNKDLDAKSDSIQSANDSIQQAYKKLDLSERNLAKTNADLKEINIRLAEERDNVLKTNWKLMENQAKFAAGKANELIEDGNPLLAKRMMMNFLSDSASNIMWPYVPEVEQAYRKSLSTIHSAEWHQDTYLEHKLKINNAIFNSEGNKILSASNDNTACLWDTDTGDTLTLRHDMLVNCAAISENGKFIATGCRDKIARVWNAETGQLVDSWKPGGNVWEILFTKDNKYILTYSSNRALSFYDVECKKELGRFPFRQQLSQHIFDEARGTFLYSFMDSLITPVSIPLLINSFQLIEKAAANDDIEGFKNILHQMCPDRLAPIVYPHSFKARVVKYNSKKETVCILCSDSVAVYGDMKTGKIIDTIPNVLDFVFSPNGKTLALAKDDGKVLLITSNEGTYEYDDNSIEATAIFQQIFFSEDGLYLIGSSSDKVVCIWDASDNFVEKARLQHRLPVRFSYMNPDGRNILTVTSDNRVNLWGHSVGYNKTSLALEDSYANAIFFNNEETLFYVASYDGHVSCYEVDTGRQMWTIATFSNSYRNLRNNCIALNTEGTILAIGNEGGEILIINANLGTLLQRYHVHTEDINSIYFVDDNNLITASRDGKVIISNINDKKATATFNHESNVLFANIIRGCQQIVSATANGIYIWETNSKEQSFFPIVHDDIESVAYDAQSNRIAIGTSNNSIYIKTLDRISNPGLVFQHGQSPKGELFLFDSYNAIEHDPELIKNIQGSMEGYYLGTKVSDLLSHKGSVDALQFSNDGKYLVSKCNGSIKVWDATSGLCLNDEIRVGIGFRCFVMSPHETYIATSSMDVKNVIPNKKNKIVDYLFLWKFDSLNKTLRKEKQRLPNWELSPDEKRKYYLK